MDFMFPKCLKRKVVIMSDFMLWLHANYIRPQIDAQKKGDYSFHFDLVRNSLPASERLSMDKCLEFTALHAFTLGLRTGAGLAGAVPQR